MTRTARKVNANRAGSTAPENRRVPSVAGIFEAAQFAENRDGEPMVPPGTRFDGAGALPSSIQAGQALTGKVDKINLPNDAVFEDHLQNEIQALKRWVLTKPWQK